MENITPDYVDFELAKLLKEKEFNELCPNRYNKKGEMLNASELLDNLKNFESFNDWVQDKENNYYKCPEIWLVIKWLYLKHGIWVSVNYLPNYKSWDFSYININWTEEENSIKLKKDIDAILTDIFQPENKFDTPEQAYLEGIKYCLTKLI